MKIKTKRAKIKEEFFKKCVRPQDTKLRAMTLNNKPLIIKTADEVWEWFEGKLDGQLAEIIEELKEDKNPYAEFCSSHEVYEEANLTAIKIVKKYAQT